MGNLYTHKGAQWKQGLSFHSSRNPQGLFPVEKKQAKNLSDILKL